MQMPRIHFHFGGCGCLLLLFLALILLVGLLGGVVGLARHGVQTAAAQGEKAPSAQK